MFILTKLKLNFYFYKRDSKILTIFSNFLAIKLKLI